MGPMRKLSAALCAVAVAALALSVVAQETLSVDPGSGTVGTEVTISGSGFGTGRPKVFLTDASQETKGENRPVKMKVLSSSDSQVVATLKKGRAGLFDVHVRPAGRDSTEVVALGAFRIELPLLGSADPATAAAGGEVTLAGQHFGTKKGRVSVGGKKAKVLAWADTEVRVRLNRKTPAGSQDVELRNKVGTSVTADAVEVSEPSTGDREDRIDFIFDRRSRYSAARDEVVAAASGTGFTLTADSSDGEVQIDLSNADLSGSGANLDAAGFTLTSGGSTWTAAQGGISVRLVIDGREVRGDFEGELERTSGDGTDPLDVSRGTFFATIP